jgi:hypothetical protein
MVSSLAVLNPLDFDPWGHLKPLALFVALVGNEEALRRCTADANQTIYKHHGYL